MAGRLAEDDPATAYRHARAARRLASRVGIVREAAGLAAYHTGEWADALAELRAARRLGAGEDSYLPVMADCERGLGRPERALDVVKAPEANKLDPMGRVELRIVESGARRDLGQFDAAVVALQVPELRDKRLRPWSARLFYAYADALIDADRAEEASDWFAKAAAADRDGETDAAERYAELEGLDIVDTEEGDGDAEDLAFGSAAEAEALNAAAHEAVAASEVVQDAVAEPATPPVPEEAPEDAQANSEAVAGPQGALEPIVDVEGPGVDEAGPEAAAVDETEDEAESGDATAIEFKAAPSETASADEAETPAEGVAEPGPAETAEVSPEATVLFLEPTRADEAHGDHEDEDEDEERGFRPE
ncbi:hypothetical protein [Spirillospora sp. NBC_01491]|uniref:hypothetical protein n=1 Tax=Spirillospora sp. NBC_01491 TaxID=2976007 RepID=UPI002E2F5CFC|nr:hypothetical protein [Spirillospora sp. NBC_01491]